MHYYTFSHPGAAEFRTRDENHLSLFRHFRSKIRILMIKIHKAFDDILTIPLIQPSTGWIEYKSKYHCSASISPDFQLFHTISTFVRLHSSNWLSPAYPTNPNEAWKPKDQTAFDTVSAAAVAQNASTNVTALRQLYMRRNFEQIVGQAYTQREDSFVVLGQVIQLLQDLDSSLSSFLLLLSACQGNGHFGVPLAQLACPGLIQSVHSNHYQLQSMDCLATKDSILASIKIHQEPQMFSTPIFQRGVIVTSAISLFIQLCFYSFLCFRCFRNFRKAKSPSSKTMSRRPRKSETRPFLQTGQVALNSVPIFKPNTVARN